MTPPSPLGLFPKNIYFGDPDIPYGANNSNSVVASLPTRGRSICRVSLLPNGPTLMYHHNNAVQRSVNFEWLIGGKWQKGR